MKPQAVTIAALAVAALAFCAPAVASPGDVLYDQYDHAGTVGSGSQDFEAALDPYDDAAADDFDVPAGPGWNVTGVEVQGTYFNGPGPASSVNVAVYSNAGDLPGTFEHVPHQRASPERGPVVEQGDEGFEILCGAAFADEDVHAVFEFVEGFFGGEAFVIGADACLYILPRGFAAQTGAWPSTGRPR